MGHLAGRRCELGMEGKGFGMGGKGFGDGRAPRQHSAPTAGFSSHASKVGQGRGSWGRLGISSRQKWEKPMLQPSCCFPLHTGLGGTAHPTEEVLRCPMPFPGIKAPRECHAGGQPYIQGKAAPPWGWGQIQAGTNPA